MSKVKKIRTFTKEEALKMLGLKEYWLSKDEQNLINEYRKNKEWEKEADADQLK